MEVALAQPLREPLNLTEVYRTRVQRVSRWAARLGGPEVDVEDVVQEVFLSVQESLSRFRGDAALDTWLFRITHNAVVRWRRRMRWRRWLSGTPEEAAGQLAMPGAAPDDLVERSQVTARVYRALDRMKERPRTLIILFELEGHSGEEIALLTGTKLATVWVQLHRARAELLKHLEAEEGRPT